MANVTMMTDVFDPQVVAEMLNETVGKSIVFSPLAEVDTTLVGQPGTTLTVPQWNYIGDAEDVAEGAAIPLAKLGKKSTEMTIKKAGKGVELTDESVLGGLGDPINTAVRQIAKSIDQKVDNDVLAAAKTATQTYTTKSGFKVEDLSNAQDIFESENDDVYVLICHPKAASKLRLNAAKEWLTGTQVGTDRVVSGTYGEVLSTQVVRSRKCQENEAFLIQTSLNEEVDTKAFKVLLKRDVLTEFDRNIVNKTTVITADRHYGVYLQNAKKVVKITVTAEL